MNVMMDIIFSTFVGGVIILIVFNANAILGDTWSLYNNNLLVQQMLVSNAQIIEGEFRNMGCGVVDTSVASITEAKDTSIQFLMALGIDQPLDSVKYYSGDVSELTNTPNPYDRYLYRVHNSESAQRIGMVTQFKLIYLTESADTIDTPISKSDMRKIKMVEITMEVQTPAAAVQDMRYHQTGQADMYSTALWKQTRLASQNLRR